MLEISISNSILPHLFLMSVDMRRLAVEPSSSESTTITLPPRKIHLPFIYLTSERNA
jgi:hypothetical protein